MPLKDPEKRKEYQREYHRKWYAENKTEKLAQNAQHRREHWDEIKARLRLRRQTEAGFWPREYEAQKRWRDKHPEYYRDKMRNYRDRILDHLGAVCIRCGFSDRRALQIDHVNGGGTAMRRHFNNQPIAYFNAIWKHIESGTEPYQVLCANCNTIKRHEEHEWHRPKS